jgi:hypothetical protein
MRLEAEVRSSIEYRTSIVSLAFTVDMLFALCTPAAETR